MTRTLAERLTLLGFRAGWSLVRRLPPRLSYSAFDAFADVAWRRRGTGVERLRSNYARVRPELDERQLDALVRAGMRSYLRYWCDAFRLPALGVADLVAGTRAVGDAPLRALLDDGEPVVVFLGHLGNWDFGGAWATTQLAPVTTVAERLEPAELFDRFLAYRERLGMTIFPLTRGHDVFRLLLAAVRQGRLVALLGDRDLTEGGVEVDLCGSPARMAVGPAALSVATGAALFPCTTHYERMPSGPSYRAGSGSSYRTVVTFHDRVPVPASGTTREKVAAMTQVCADVFGDGVREHTQDWHMLQRVFVADLEPRAGAGRSAATPDHAADRGAVRTP